MTGTMQVFDLAAPPNDITANGVATWNESARQITVDIRKINDGDPQINDAFIDIVITATTTSGGISDKIVLRLQVFNCSSPTPGYVDPKFGYLTNTNADLVLEFPVNTYRSVLCTPYKFYIADDSGETPLAESSVAWWLTEKNDSTECAQNICLKIAANSTLNPVVVTGKRVSFEEESIIYSESFTISICRIEKPANLYGNADPLIWSIPSTNPSLVFYSWVMQPTANNADCPSYSTNVADPTGPNVSNLSWNSSDLRVSFTLPSHTIGGAYVLNYQA